MKTQTNVEINEAKENEIPVIEMVTLQWADKKKKIELTVSKHKNVDQ